MLKLHGFAVSNYYNAVKHYLLDKGIDFEEVPAVPSQDPSFLAVSPLGKVPVLEVETGTLTETNVILEYLEVLYPEPPRYPTDPFDYAKSKQLFKTIELYVEAPAHRMLGVLFGREVPDAVQQECKGQMERGLEGVRRLARMTPYLCGDQLTAVDLFALYAFKLSNSVTRKLFSWDLIAELPGLNAVLDELQASPVGQRVLTENKAALKAMQG